MSGVELPGMPSQEAADREAWKWSQGMTGAFREGYVAGFSLAYRLGWAHAIREDVEQTRDAGLAREPQACPPDAKNARDYALDAPMT